MRLLPIFLIIISGFLLAWNIYDYFLYSSKVLESPEAAATNAVSQVKAEIDSVVLIVSQSAGNLVGEIESSALVEEDLRFSISQEASKHSFIKGVRVAFEPYQFDSDKELFGLIYERQEDTFKLIEDNYNYRDTSEVSAGWYKEPWLQHTSTLSKPSTGDDELMLLNYSDPVFWRGGAGAQQFIGVVNVLFSFEGLTALTSSIIQNSLTQIYIVDSQGNLMLHDNQLQESGSISVVVPQLLEGQANYLFDNTSGKLEIEHPDPDSLSTLVFNTSEQTGWKIAAEITVLNKAATSEMVKDKTVNLYLSGGLFLVLTLLFMYNYFRFKKK